MKCIRSKWLALPILHSAMFHFQRTLSQHCVLNHCGLSQFCLSPLRATNFACAVPSFLHHDQFDTSIKWQPHVSGLHFTGITCHCWGIRPQEHSGHQHRSHLHVKRVDICRENLRQIERDRSWQIISPPWLLDSLVLRCNTLCGT